MYVFLQVGHEKKHKGVLPLKFLNYHAEEDILLYHGSEAGVVMRWIKGLQSSLVPSISY